MIRRTLFAGIFVMGLAGLAAAEMPIGFVDTEKIINEERRFVKAQKEIDEMVDRFERDRERLEGELEKLSEEMQDAQSSRQEDLMEILGRRLQDRSREYQDFMAEAFGPEGIIETQTDEIMGPLYEKLEQACKKVGEDMRIPLILDLENISPWYAADTLDITDEVLAELEKIW